MKHKFDLEFITICRQILKEDLKMHEWKLIESSGQFQSKNYCGGFDGTENEFTFTYYDEKGDEFWFQLPLLDIGKVENGIIREVSIKKAH